MLELRDNPEVVERIVSDFLPSTPEKVIAFRQLLQSVQFAQSVAPHAWSVSLHPNRHVLFRLNVGQVETLIVGGGWIRFCCVGILGEPPFVGDFFEERIRPYASVRAPQCVFIGALDEFVLVAAALRGGHEKFIAAAGTRKDGLSVRGTPFAKSHSAGLISYAEAFINGISLVDDRRKNEGDTVQDTFIEGRHILRPADTYERNPAARKRCLEHYGAVCIVCGFSSERVYGDRVRGLIEVHHLHPLSATGEEHSVNPIEDLRPVCPNCHEVIHSKTPPYAIRDVQNMLRTRSSLPSGSSSLPIERSFAKGDVD